MDRHGCRCVGRDPGCAQSRLVVYGFGLFLISSLLWSVVGWFQREMSLVVLQGTFTVINIVGIYRWLEP